MNYSWRFVTLECLSLHKLVLLGTVGDQKQYREHLRVSLLSLARALTLLRLCYIYNILYTIIDSLRLYALLFVSSVSSDLCLCLFCWRETRRACAQLQRRKKNRERRAVCVCVCLLRYRGTGLEFVRLDKRRERERPL